jgi:hypothetical protein
VQDRDIAAHNPAHFQPNDDQIHSDLARVVDAWPTLPEELRRAIASWCERPDEVCNAILELIRTEAR